MIAASKEILGIGFSPSSFKRQAESIVSDPLIKRISIRIKTLEAVNEQIADRSVAVIPPANVLSVIKRFKNAIITYGINDFADYDFDRKGLRILTYELAITHGHEAAIVDSPIELTGFLRLLESSWRDAFILGLLYSYFLKWDEISTEARPILSDFISKRLNNYEGERKIIKALRNNIRFLDCNQGDVHLGAHLAIHGLSLVAAPMIFELPKSWFQFPYFSKVIDAFYERSKARLLENCGEILEALRVHNRIESTKRTLSKIIIQADSSNYSGVQDVIKKFAFEKIGDPGNSSSWQPLDSFTSTEVENIKKARNILNEWITREFINVFFEKCINDFRRKKFWLKYSKVISQFKVVGSTYTRSLLKSDSRIKEYVDARYGTTNSSSDSNSALMFTINNHLFIEFSDDGAFYAYKLSNKNAPSIDESYFQSTSKLKTPSMKWLAYRSGVYINQMNEEGRLGHNDGELNWEAVADFWLRNKANINV